jgi:hypothetical protein
MCGENICVYTIAFVICDQKSLVWLINNLIQCKLIRRPLKTSSNFIGIQFLPFWW